MVTRLTHSVNVVFSRLDKEEVVILSQQENINRGIIVQFLKLYSLKKNYLKDYEKRDLFFALHDSYGDSGYRSGFFALEGSPTRVCGYVLRVEDYNGGSRSYPYEFNTTLGKFYLYDGTNLVQRPRGVINYVSHVKR